MHGVVLVGGFGSRLRPLTATVPKPMLPVGHEPLIAHLLRRLAAGGVTDVTLALGFRPEPFREAFPDGRSGDVRLHYAVEPEPLDTAGAIRFAAEHTGIEDTFVVANGDVLTDLDVGALVADHRRTGATATLHLLAVADPSAFGVADLAPDGRILGFVEKPAPGTAPSNRINAGTYVFEPGVLELIPPGVRVSVERDTFPRLVAAGGLHGFARDGYWLDAGRPDQYLRANLDLLDRARIAPIAPGALVAADAVVEHSLVGAGAVVGRRARLTDSVILPGAVVGDDAVVSSSIVMGTVGDRARLDDVVVGAEGSVAAGDERSGVRIPDPDAVAVPEAPPASTAEQLRLLPAGDDGSRRAEPAAPLDPAASAPLADAPGQPAAAEPAATGDPTSPVGDSPEDEQVTESVAAANPTSPGADAPVDGGPAAGAPAEDAADDAEPAADGAPVEHPGSGAATSDTDGRRPVLVIGGAGFIGSHLVERLLADGAAVDVVDDLSSGSLGSLAEARRAARAGAGDLRIHTLDATGAELADLLRLRRPRLVYHLAVLPSHAAPAPVHGHSFASMLGLLEASRVAGVEKIVVAVPATAIYGHPSTRDLPAKEGARRGRGVRGVVANAIIDLLAEYRAQHDIEFTVLALTSTYGPRQRTGVVAAALAAAEEGGPFSWSGDGRHTRDFVYVDDAVDALARAGERGGGLVVNVGTGVQTSVRELWALVGAGAAAAPPTPARPDELGRFAVSCVRARIHLGWSPWTDLATGIDATRAGSTAG